MWSHFNVPFTKDYLLKTIGYCYHSVDIITFGLTQIDHLKRLLLYKNFATNIKLSKTLDEPFKEFDVYGRQFV